MPKTDPRVDAYIAQAPEFARPILTHLRTLVHKGCPNVEEDMKWSRPHFIYNGGILAGMSAFKAHCAFGFWNSKLDLPANEGAAGQFGRITSLKDLPKDSVLLGYVKEATRLSDAGDIAKPMARTTKSAPRAPLAMPDDFQAALKKKPKALAIFEKFSPSHRREYIEWIIGAKREETRTTRITKAVAQILESKPLNWKYMSQ